VEFVPQCCAYIDTSCGARIFCYQWRIGEINFASKYQPLEILKYTSLEIGKEYFTSAYTSKERSAKSLG